MISMLFPDIINKYVRPYNEPLVIIENNAEGGMVATQLHYDDRISKCLCPRSVKI